MIATGTALAIGAITGAGATTYAAHKSSSAAEKASDASTAAANRAAELEAQSAAEALAFQKDEAAREQGNFENTQRLNYEQYLEEQARLQPYRNLGLGSLAQMASGIPRRTTATTSKAGTLGSVMGG